MPQGSNAPSDEVIAAQARDGSLVAFEQLVLRYRGRLLDFLVRRGASDHDAEDLVQESLLRVWDKLDHYDPGRRFSTWLFTVASRIAIGAARRRRPQLIDPEQWSSGAMLAADDDDPARSVAQREMGRRLWAVADEVLPEEQRSLLWLRYAEGMEIAELAELSGKKAGAVRVALHRARVRLAHHLEEHSNSSTPRATRSPR